MVWRFTKALRTSLTIVFLLPLAVSCTRQQSLEQVLQVYREDGRYQDLPVNYPPNEVVFPPEISACTFSWKETAAGADMWLLLFQFAGDAERRVYQSEKREWTPQAEDWERIKQCSCDQPSKVTVLGYRRKTPVNILERGQVMIRTSRDPVGAPLFYREVNLPFADAVRDPTRIRWRFGSISSPKPPRVVLEHLPVCGNCHSFSADGRTLGMDVDYANDKGSYVITQVEKEMMLATSDVMTWADFRKADALQTFGLLSQISPDGQTVISTVKDKSVFVARPDLAFSQLFFPIRGILAVYYRQTRQFEALPGADDPDYVQSNPTWSPDGREIVFARARAYQLKSRDAEGKLLLNEQDCAEFLREGKEFRFDLYRIPFNRGRGGKPEPVTGASRNGKSNFFARFSPDGKWIIFCQARSFMLLQPDSELYIIPAAGGEARKLRCNTGRMNSWHSWSPNSRWVVFSSKAASPYTQLFLTHIDENGESTPPVVLANFTAPDRAANIPEFVNTQPDSIANIREQFLDDNSLVRSAYVLEVNGDVDQAIAKYVKALEINAKNAYAHQRLGFLLFNQKQQFQEGLAHTRTALQLNPTDGCAHYDLGMAFKYQEQLESAIEHLATAVRLLPAGFDRRYNPIDMQCSLGEALLDHGKAAQAASAFSAALSLSVTNAAIEYRLAMALAAQGLTDEAVKHYTVVQRTQPQVDTSAHFHLLLAANYASDGRTREALSCAQRALELAQAANDARLAEMVRQQIEELRSGAGHR